jgi:predicted regulator of Ras-like GTPase activity (Roadblock/LC7/MglB family)
LDHTVIKMAESAPLPLSEVVPAPAAAAPAPVETRFLTLAITEVYRAWPEFVQREIIANQLAGVSLALPFGMIELAIRQGKVALPWRVIRSWIKPPVIGYNSPHDATILELPLKTITPLFLAELKTAQPQKKVTVDPTIPDLFSGNAKTTSTSTAPKVNAAAPAPAQALAPSNPPLPKVKPADTNYFAKKTAGEVVEEVAPKVKKGPHPGTDFLNRYATPSEIVTKASALPGVHGALIALPDGLLVASDIPPTMNADTIAAFLPQIFGRVTQCTKELRLGDLNNLNFTVGHIPWKIFKVGAIYFAAFGSPHEPLPTAQLAEIAAELDRKAK